MSDLIEEWVSMSRLAQEEDTTEAETEGLQTQGKTASWAKWANLMLDLEICSVDHSPLALAARATLEQINYRNQPKAKSKH